MGEGGGEGWGVSLKRLFGNMGKARLKSKKTKRKKKKHTKKRKKKNTKQKKKKNTKRRR